MKNLGGAKTVLAHHPAVMQAQHEICIFMPPANERLIKPIHTLKISFPHAHIAASDALPGKLAPDPPHPIGKTQKVGELAGMPERALFNPEKLGATTNLLGSVQHTLCQLGRQQNTAAVDEASGLGKGLVLGNEVHIGYAVSIQEDDIATAGCSDPAIANTRSSEANIWMPDMNHAQKFGNIRANNQLTVLCQGAIIGNNYFEMAIALQRQTMQDCQQGITAVIGGNHHGNKVGSIHFELDYKRAKCTLSR